MFTWKNCQIFIEANCFVELSNKIPRSVVDHCYWSNEAKWETSFNTPAKHPFFRQKKGSTLFLPLFFTCRDHVFHYFEYVPQFIWACLRNSEWFHVTNENSDECAHPISWARTMQEISDSLFIFISQTYPFYIQKGLTLNKSKNYKKRQYERLKTISWK